MKDKAFDHVFLHAPGPMPAGSALWINSCGHLASRTGVRFVHGGYSCPHLVERGRGRVIVGGREAIMAPGDMFCLMDECAVEYVDDPADPWTFSWVHLIGPAAPAVCREMGFTPEAPWRHGVAFHGVKRALEDIREPLLRNTPVMPYRYVEMLYRFVAAAMPDDARHAPGDLVQRAEDRMESLLHDCVNVSELARQLHVDRSTLLAAFRRERGCTPIAMLRRKRVERAHRMLSTSDAKLSVIAAACGFRNEKYLIRVYRELMGTTPRADRVGVKPEI